MSSYAYAKIANNSIPVPVPDIGNLKPPLALRPVLPTKTKLLETERKSMPEVMGALLAARSGTDPVTASGSVDLVRYGRPLDARSLVAVRGAGLAHDGLWFVRSVTHTLARGSWNQSFQLARDGLVSQLQQVAV